MAHFRHFFLPPGAPDDDDDDPLLCTPDDPADVPELDPEDADAFRCWYSSCRVAFSDSSSLIMSSSSCVCSRLISSMTWKINQELMYVVQ